MQMTWEETTTTPHSPGKIFWIALIFSIFMHILLFFAFPRHFFSTPETSSVNPSEKIIRVKQFKQDQDGQIVDVQDQKHITKDAVDTNYLSDKNRKVDKQTRSIEVTKQQNQSMTSKTDQQSIEKPSKYSLNLSDNALNKLTAKNETQQMSINQSLSSNYLPDITIGGETLLNTKEFAFNAFYIRMKRDIEGFWRPAIALTQNPHLNGTYVTVLTIVLDDEGYLAQKLVVARSSGIPDLDQEAIRSVEKASPFLNVPKELLQENGLLSVNFGFIFDSTPKLF